MSYDKCGAGNVAGFFKVLAQLKPKQLKAVGVLAVTRNNCGEEGYVADEIITSRAGVRIRVGNTDAEGIFDPRANKTRPLIYCRSNGYGWSSVLYQRISTERGQSTSLHDGHIDWTCHSCIWIELHGEHFAEEKETRRFWLGSCRPRSTMDQHATIRRPRNFNQWATKSAIHSRSQPFDEKFVIVSDWTDHRCLSNRILTSSSIKVKQRTSCNVTIKAAARLLVAINFLRHSSPESPVSINTVAIRKRLYATLIWILLAVVVICRIHPRVAPFRHSVNCSWLAEFSRLHFYPLDADYLSLSLIVLELWLISSTDNTRNHQYTQMLPISNRNRDS